MIRLGGIFAAKSSGMNIREDWYKKMRPELLKELSELSLKVSLKSNQRLHWWDDPAYLFDDADDYDSCLCR
jgi:hypothetical protein